MSPRIKEIDHRGQGSLLIDVPDCDGRWEMPDGSSVAVYMSGVNPSVGGRDLAIEFSSIQHEETVLFRLDDQGESTRVLLDNMGNERVIKVELRAPLFVPVVQNGENRTIPNGAYLPGVA